MSTTVSYHDRPLADMLVTKKETEMDIKLGQKNDMSTPAAPIDSNVKVTTSTAMHEHPIYIQTQQIFSSLRLLAVSYAESNPALSQEAEKLEQRFGEWCKRLGAHLQGVYSLDERLRDASAVKEHVTDCLGDMCDALKSEEGVANGSEGASSASANDESTPLGYLGAKSAISSSLGFANSILDVLFRVIPVIRPALSADRYERAMETVIPDEDDFKQICRAKLLDMFPKLSPQLLSRLVLASLQRRRLFQYTTNYSLKFQSEPAWEPSSVATDPLASSPLVPGQLHIDANQTTAFLDPADTPSKIDFKDASSLLSKAASNLDPFGQGPEVDSDTRSMKSMALSQREMKYSIPPFPEFSEDGLRECVACHLMLPLPTKQVWRSHILRDIRPYVCTISHCSVDPNKLYSSRRAWFEHEVTFHRRRWPCPAGCSAIITNISSYREHVSSEHSSHAQELLSHSLPRGQEIPANAEAVCPFCALCVKPRRQIESHIAWHQVQVGLMVLQSSIIEDSDDEELLEGSEDDLSGLDKFPMMDMPIDKDSRGISAAGSESQGTAKTGERSEEAPVPDEEFDFEITPKMSKKDKKKSKKASAQWEESDTASDLPHSSTTPGTQSTDKDVEENTGDKLPTPDEEVDPFATRETKKDKKKRPIVTWETLTAVDPTSRLSPDLEAVLETPAHLSREARQKSVKHAQERNVKLLTGIEINTPSLGIKLTSGPSVRYNWFVVPSYDFAFNSSSPIQIGQVLTDPLDLTGCVLSNDVLSSMALPQDVHQALQQREAQYDLGETKIMAERVTTYQSPLHTGEFISALIDRPEVAKILKGPNRIKARRIFIITGLKVMEGTRVIRERKKPDLSVGVELGGASVRAGFSRESSTSFSIPDRFIFAYSLLQARRSSLGSLAVDRYTKGAVL